MTDYSFSEFEKTAVKAFLGHYIAIKALHDSFQILGHENEHRYVLHCTAPSFFSEMSVVYSHYLNLAFARFLDPFKQGNNDNLSLEYFNQLREWQSPEKEQLTTLYAKIVAFKDCVKQVRNKILSHNDFNTYINQDTLGGYPEGADIEFMNNVFAFIDLIHKLAFGSNIGDITTTQEGDAYALIRLLKFGLAFDRMTNEKKWRDLMIIEHSKIIDKIREEGNSFTDW